MTTNPFWPLTSWQCAFNAGANDPATTPSWTELISRLWSWDGSYGRQYEADVNQAGEAEATLDDLDEYLNPANGSSPYAPGVLPYRQFIHQVMWPPTPVGSAVNMLNTTSGYDVGFDATTVGTTPSWITAVGGTTPVVGTTTPRSAPNDLGWSVVGTATVQGVSFPVACIPGQQYTASVYVRQSSASTQGIYVDATAGTTTTTTGAYVRLTVTFTATQPTHTISVKTSGTAVAGSVLLDDIQMEPGASASTFNNGIGPVVYGVARGLVERWPSTWDFNGIRGRCDITCVDALAALAQIPMHTDYVNTVLGLAPDFYWWLQDQQGATSFADVSGNNGPPLANLVSKFGAGTAPNAGQSMNIVGDPSGTGVQITPGSPPNTTTEQGTVLANGPLVRGVQMSPMPPVIGTSWALTLACWVSYANTTPATQQYAASLSGSSPVSALNTGYNAPIAVALDGSGHAIAYYLNVNNSTGTAWQLPSPTVAAPADSTPHLLIAQVTQTSSNTIVGVSVDGSAFTTTTYATGSFGGILSGPANSAQVGGVQVPGFFFDVLNGNVAHVAAWSRALSVGEVSKLWTAGGLGFAGELSGARIARYLGYVYNGLTNIDTGASIMSAGTVTEGSAALDACQFVETSENGDFWADGTGTAQFRGRQYRYLNTTPDWVFGENAGGGEAPYEQGIAFDFDPTLIGNVVTITQTNGIVVQVNDPTSIKEYFPHTFEREIGVSSVLEVYDAANWFLATRKDPKQRVANIALHPSANPALWPVALGIRKGDRITVKRRTSAGLTMTIDFFVDQIEHAHSPGDWLTSLQLSPVMGQPWILQDATYGLLGSTTRLGY